MKTTAIKGLGWKMITFQHYERGLSKTFSTSTQNKQALPHTHHKLIEVCVTDPKAGQNPKAPS